MQSSALDAHPSSPSASGAAVPASFARAGLLLAVLLPSLCFLAAAATRRLNFDEPLALRSGWLLIEGIPAYPAFCMPLTLGLGFIAHRVQDPGTLFALLRISSALVALSGLCWMLRATRASTAVVALSAAFCLLQGSFGTYGYEFRYDLAILFAWCAAFALLQPHSALDDRIRAAALGLCTSWLAAHHLKGALFALFLYLFFWLACACEWRAGAQKGRVGSAITAFHASIFASAALWLTLCWMTGNIDAVLALYRGFASVALSEPKVWPWQSLPQSLVRDSYWWLAALGASVLTLRDLYAGSADGTARSRDPRLWALLFAGASLLVLLSHPHPWPYMLAPSAPFLAYLMARVLVSRVRDAAPSRRPWLLAGLMLPALLLYLTTGLWPGLHYPAALRASMQPQVETLRELRALAGDQERIIDPSGLAYFQPPCTSEWYLDSLFARLAEEGMWMRDLGSRHVAECPLVLNSNRLSLLPGAQWQQIAGRYQLMPGGYAIARGDPRIAKLAERFAGSPLPKAPRELKSFWW